MTVRTVYPYFFSDPRGRFSPLVEIESAILNRCHRLRVYLPPGYEENTLARYPFAYMQDGQNLFFPHEAFQHKDWGVQETSQIRLYALQAYQTKKDSLSQPATAARNLSYETDATIARRLANVAGKPINFARPGTATTYS